MSLPIIERMMTDVTCSLRGKSAAMLGGSGWRGPHGQEVTSPANSPQDLNSANSHVSEFGSRYSPRCEGSPSLFHLPLHFLSQVFPLITSCTFNTMLVSSPHRTLTNTSGLRWSKNMGKYGDWGLSCPLPADQEGAV